MITSSMSEKDKVNYLKSFFSGLKALRSNFENIWTDIDKFVYGYTGSYDSNPMKGQMTFENVYDQTALNANTDATNALVGILWQQGGRSIKISPAENLPDSQDVREWFNKQTDKFVRVLDNRNAKLESSFIQYMSNALSHGSSGIGVFRATTSPLVFRPYALRTMYYQENDEGIVDTVAIRMWNPVYEVVQKYGYENVHEEVRKKYDNATMRNDDVEIIQFIMPNTDKETMKERPVLSIHVDMQHGKVVKDSFYEEMPLHIGRIYKNSFETYGRCPAINVLQTIKRLNVVQATLIEGIEKTVNPPKGAIGDATVDNGVLDLSPNGLNMFNVQGLEGQSPIFPIDVVGDLSSAQALSEQWRMFITEAYHINKLIDMNNDSQLTATEALILDRIRNTSLGALLSNQINELFTPLIETSFNILFNDGYFGYVENSEEHKKASIKAQLEGQLEPIEVLPEAIAKAYLNGEELYRVEYLTPAARMLASEEANNIVEAVNVTAQFAQIGGQEVMDNVDIDESVRDFWKLKGLGDMLADTTERDERRTQRAQMQQQQMQVQQAQQEMALSQQAKEVQSNE